jgi:hypothetical protein
MGFKYYKKKKQTPLIIQPPISGSQFSGVAVKDQQTLTDTTNITPQKRYDYNSATLNPTTVTQHVDLTGRKLFIADLFISALSTGNAQMFYFTLGMSNDVGDFDGVITFPLSNNAGTAITYNHHFDPPLLFEVIPKGMLGGLNEHWLTSYHDGVLNTTRFFLSGWFE